MRVSAERGPPRALFSYEDRVRELGFFSVEKALGRLNWSLQGTYRKEGKGLFTDNETRRSNGFNLTEPKFRLDDRKKFFT